MISATIKNALEIVCSYLCHNYSQNELGMIKNELTGIVGETMDSIIYKERIMTYDDVQVILASLNEKEPNRKSKGVYYTPRDVVEFITNNAVKLLFGNLKPNNLHVMDMNGIPYSSYCFDKTVYDPTCGAGEFLLFTLNMKLDLLELHHSNITKGKIQKVVSTIYGNDLNADSIIITQIRILLCVLKRFGVQKANGLSQIMKSSFQHCDYVLSVPDKAKCHDIIIGNPPYVEDSKCENPPTNRYGNIYANVLSNAAKSLKKGGVIGFITPLSYAATPRMKKIRDELYTVTPEQYILSFSDRPDCLFASVHQKLCIMLGKNSDSKIKVYTGNYRYWYKEERTQLFETASTVKNDYVCGDFIPKLGSTIEVSIYKKILRQPNRLNNLLNQEGVPLYLNMRAAFWIKSFLESHKGSEYKEFKCKDSLYAHYCMCIMNSSLFWWFWICVSDCWHITNKELSGFGVPDLNDAIFNELAVSLEEQLEKTKVYVGTKQTDYEYKHKECVDEIHEIDDYLNALYGLTQEESIYIKNFAYRYRISGGVENECN